MSIHRLPQKQKPNLMRMFLLLILVLAILFTIAQKIGNESSQNQIVNDQENQLFRNPDQQLFLVKCTNGLLGFADQNGKILINCQYEEAYPFDNQVTSVKKDAKWALLHQHKGMLTAFDYQYIGGFSQGLAAVKKQDKWGFIDSLGKETIGCTFDEVGLFSQGLAWAKQNQMIGYITPKGIWQIKPQYMQANNFSENFAAVLEDSLWYFIDTKGEKIHPQGFKSPSENHRYTFRKGHVLVKDQKWGILWANKTLFPACICDSIISQANQYVCFQDGKILKTFEQTMPDNRK